MQSLYNTASLEQDGVVMKLMSSNSAETLDICLVFLSVKLLRYVSYFRYQSVGIWSNVSNMLLLALLLLLRVAVCGDLGQCVQYVTFVCFPYFRSSVTYQLNFYQQHSKGCSQIKNISQSSVIDWTSLIPCSPPWVQSLEVFFSYKGAFPPLLLWKSLNFWLFFRKKSKFRNAWPPRPPSSVNHWTLWNIFFWEHP